MEDRSDKTLLVRLDSPETFEDAAKVIVERYFLRLRNLIRVSLSQRIPGRIDEEDVMQSMWRSFFRRSSRFEIDESLFPVLATIAKRKVSRAICKHTAEKRDVRKEEVLTKDFGISILKAMHQSSTDAEAIEVMESIDMLPDELRKIVIMRLFGHSYKEIAHSIGITERSVHRKKDLAKDWLKKFLDDFET